MIPDGAADAPPDRRIRVCDLALFAPSSSSGVKTYITSKIDYVRERSDIDHVVIVPGPAEQVTTQGRSRVIVVRGVPSPYPGLRLAFNLPRVAALIEAEAPDVIELNCQYTLGWAAFLATRRSRTPIVGVYHTDVAACARHWAAGGGRIVASAVERIVEFYQGLIYRHCTLTVLLNAGMQGRVARLGVHRTRCLSCGVDPATFNPSRRDPEFRRGLGIEPGQKVVFYAGRLSREKELDLLLAAFARLPQPDFVLLIAGDGPDAPAIARYAAAEPHVRYLGDLDSRALLATAYASSDAFVAPGRYETFGMSTIEAIASGLPVVGIAGSGTASFVPEYSGVMVPAGEVAALASAIQVVTSWDPETTRQACHRFAATTFAWDRILDGYFATYRELIDQSRRARGTPA
jgi:glycosyltransferase involved in cell wall biosynthesis